MNRLSALLLLLPLLACRSVAQRPAVSPASTTPLVMGETFTVASTTLHETRRINVYIPPGYTDTTRLPVLYMPDGGMAEDFLHVAGLVQVSVGNGTMRPFLLVGIENTERRRDMTGPTDNPEDRKIATHVGGSAEFRTFIRTELMPAVKRRYRTTNETAIIGESLAGLFVVETLLREPDLFDTYIAFDPSLWWNNEGFTKSLAQRPLRASGSRKTLYLAASSDAKEGVERFAQALSCGRSAVIVCQYVPMTDETHATIYHPAALRAVRTLFKPK